MFYVENNVAIVLIINHLLNLKRMFAHPSLSSGNFTNKQWYYTNYIYSLFPSVTTLLGSF